MVAMKRSAPHLRSFIDRVSLPNATNLPLLIVRAPDDEASLSLGLMQGANRLVWVAWRVIGLHWVTLLWNAVLRVADRVKARTILERGAELWVMAVISLLFLQVYLGKYTAPEGQHLTIFTVFSAVLFIPVLIMLLTILVAALLIIPVGLINALALLPFGPAFSIFSPFIEASAESTPPGASTVVQLSWESEPAIVETAGRYPVGGTGWIDSSDDGHP